MSRIKKHYHWVIAALVLIQLTIHGGTNNNLNLFVLPVSEAFGISRSAISVAGSLKAVASFLGTFFSGAVLLRLGYRKSVLTFMAVAVVGLGIVSSSSNLIVFSLGYIIFGLADGVCISAGPPRIINAWFHRHQGTVLGMVTAATGLGGSLMCLILSGVIEHAGWNNAYLCGAVLITVIALAMLILVRDRPEDMRLKPYGEGNRTVKKKEGDDHWIGYTNGEMHRSAVFYLMILGTFLSNFFSGGTLAVMVPHLQDRGLSAQEAAAMQSTLMLVLAGVKLGCGILTDTIGAKRVMLLCLGGTVGCLVLFPLVSGTVTAIAAVLAFSLSLPLTSVMLPLLSSALFGYQAQTSCLGVFMAMASLAGIFSGPAANLVYDALGTYNPFFWIGAAVCIALIGLYRFMYKLAERDKQRILAAHQIQ